MTEKTHTTNPSTEIGEFFKERNLRAFQVRGDRMSPTFKRGDWALVVPINAYVWEGIYLVGIENPALFRVQSIGNGNLRLSSDNKHYDDHVMSRAEFRNEVVAKVAWKVEQLDRSL